MKKKPALPTLADFAPGAEFVINEFDVPLVCLPDGRWFNWFGGSPRSYSATSLKVDNNWPAGSFDAWLRVVAASLPGD